MGHLLACINADLSKHNFQSYLLDSVLQRLPKLVKPGVQVLDSMRQLLDSIALRARTMWHRVCGQLTGNPTPMQLATETQERT